MVDERENGGTRNRKIKKEVEDEKYEEWRKKRWMRENGGMRNWEIRERWKTRNIKNGE